MMKTALCLLPFAFAGTLLAQQPQFRAGTDLVAIDFQVIDENGQPVTDLKPAELTLKVDGRTRDIRALQFVKVARTSGDSPAPVASLPLPFATNDAITPGRIVIIVVDHEQLRPGEGKAAIDAAGRLVDRLSPTDRVGLVTLPYGKVEVDLTTNHARVKTSLTGIVAFAVINTQGQVVAEWTEEGGAVVVRPLVTAAVVPPGDYRLRVAAVDTTGRRGAVDYEFAAATLDLPIAPGAQPLISAPANVLLSADPDRRVATGDIELKSVTPGDYVLRLVVKLDERVIGQATRVIRVLRPGA